ERNWPQSSRKEKRKKRIPPIIRFPKKMRISREVRQMLLSDEQYVVKWLSQYGALPKTQVVRLLRDKSPATAEKIIRNLKKEMRIADVGGGYYLGLDNLCKP